MAEQTKKPKKTADEKDLAPPARRAGLAGPASRPTRRLASKPPESRIKHE